MTTPRTPSSSLTTYLQLAAVALGLGAAAALASGCTDAGAMGTVAAPLVGAWYAGAGGTSAPYDPSTGSWGTPSGQGMVFQFAADGTYVRALQSYHSAGGCTNGFTAFESGTVDADGATIRLYPTAGHMQVSDSCAPSLDSDEPLTELHADVYQWTALDAGPSWIHLVDQAGNSGDFRRL